MSTDVWLDHRAAIDCYGREFVDGWTGAETLARGSLSYNADFRRILVDVPDQIAAKAYDEAVQAGIDAGRAALGNPITNKEKPCVVCGEPSVLARSGEGYCAAHSEHAPPPAPLPAEIQRLMRAEAAASVIDEGTAERERAEAGREILLQQLDHDYEPDRILGQRLIDAWAGLRDVAFAGKVKTAVTFPDAQTCAQRARIPLTLNELRAHYPDAGDLTVKLARYPFPVRIVFLKEDILKGPQAPTRGEHLPQVKMFLFDPKHATKRALLSDEEAAVEFRRLVKGSTLRLPRTSQLAEQIRRFREQHENESRAKKASE